MKIEITFDEENNEFALVTVDDRTVRMTKNISRCGDIPEHTAGRAIFSTLFDAVYMILGIREIQGSVSTFQELDDLKRDLIEELF
jgi:hypothetical protein